MTFYYNSNKIVHQFICKGVSFCWSAACYTQPRSSLIRKSRMIQCTTFHTSLACQRCPIELPVRCLGDCIWGSNAREELSWFEPLSLPFFVASLSWWFSAEIWLVLFCRIGSQLLFVSFCRHPLQKRIMKMHITFSELTNPYLILWAWK